MIIAAAKIGGLLQGGLAGIAMIGVLVVVHEFGHFVFAKLFGVGVPVFSVGMGPRVWGFHYKGTDYRLSAVPVGGYVQLAGADPFGDPDWDVDLPDDENFMKKPIWQRLLVMLGGPLFNLLTPFVVFTAVLMLGEPHWDTTVGEVYPDTPAEAIGLQPDDVVVSVLGEPVDTWLEMRELAEARGPGQAIAFTVRRGEREYELTIPAGVDAWTDDGRLDTERMGFKHQIQSARVGVDDPASPAGQAGVQPGDAIVAVDGTKVRTYRQLLAALDGRAHTLSVKRQVGSAPDEVTLEEHELALVADEGWQAHPDDLWSNRWGLLPAELFVADFAKSKDGVESPAKLQGMRKGDRIWSIDGHQIRGFYEMVDRVAETVPETTDASTEPRPLEVVVRRDGELHTLSFTPRMDRVPVPGGITYHPYMGVAQLPDAMLSGDLVPVYYGPFEAARRSVPQVGRVFEASVSGLAALLTGEMYIREGLGGPVAIFDTAAKFAKEGLHAYARLIGIFSISLGLINLLPIPVLDGGQILFYSLEGIRGRPLPLAVRERIQMAGVLFLVGLMLLVTVFDVNRAFFGGGPT